MCAFAAFAIDKILMRYGFDMGYWPVVAGSAVNVISKVSGKKDKYKIECRHERGTLVFTTDKSGKIEKTPAQKSIGESFDDWTDIYRNSTIFSFVEFMIFIHPAITI